MNKARTPAEATGNETGVVRLFEAIGAHRNPQRQIQERDRSPQRAIVGIVLPVFWLLSLWRGVPVDPPVWFIVLGLAYGCGDAAR